MHKELREIPGYYNGLEEELKELPLCPNCEFPLKKEKRREIEKIAPFIVPGQPALLTPLCLLGKISYREIESYDCPKCDYHREYSSSGV